MWTRRPSFDSLEHQHYSEITPPGFSPEAPASGALPQDSATDRGLCRGVADPARRWFAASDRRRFAARGCCSACGSRDRDDVERGDCHGLDRYRWWRDRAGGGIRGRPAASFSRLPRCRPSDCGGHREPGFSNQEDTRGCTQHTTARDARRDRSCGATPIPDYDQRWPCERRARATGIAGCRTNRTG